MEKIQITYEDLQKKCVMLAEKITHSGFQPDMIVSITRGGLLSAYFLADRLGVKSIETINISSYEDSKSGNIQDLTKFKKDFTGFKTLIVDDLVDSGKTMHFILSNYAFNPMDTKIATIFVKPHASIKPDFFVEEILDEQRVIFPYER